MDLRARVRQLIGDNLLDDAGRNLFETLPDSASLIEAGLLDSLGVVQMVALLEQTFALVFDPLDISVENLESVDKVARLVGERMP
jgi:acyl carrier protein